jgi:hypothetical protein
MAYLTNEQLTGEWIERPFSQLDRLILRNAEYGAKFWRFIAGQEWHHWVRPAELVTIDQAARLLGVSSQLVGRWWARGDVTHHASPDGHRMLMLREVRAIWQQRLNEAERLRKAR